MTEFEIQEEKKSLNRNFIDNWCYIPSWQRNDILEELDLPALKNRKLLIFSDCSNFGQFIVEFLVANEINFQAIENVNDSKFYELFNKLKAPPDQIIYVLGNFSSEKNPKESFHQLVNLIKTLSDLFFESEITLTIVTAGVYEILGNEVICPERSLLLGISKVISKEIENISCSLIDLEIATEVHRSFNLSCQIFTDIFRQNTSFEVAYRGTHRWTEYYKPFSLTRSPLRNSLLKKQGTYFITGGLGGIGLEIGEYLAKNWAGKLFLISRKTLPPKSLWENLDDYPIATKTIITKLKMFDKMGIQYHVFQAEVSNYEQMKAAFEECLKLFHKIDGIIYSAGISGGGILQRRTEMEINDVFLPKIEGLRVLKDLLKEYNMIQFLVTFSSLSAQLGEVGNTDYCAANCFVDSATKEIEKELGIRALAINWAKWSEVGMAKNEHIRLNPIQWISPTEGIEVFERILTTSFQQIIVSPFDLNSLLFFQRHDPIEWTASLTRNSVIN